MRKVRFVQADVFSDSPFGGNPVVVIPDAEGITPDQMQTIARGLGSAETAFLRPATVPDADLRLCCYTPTTRVPFSGHQALGAAYVWGAEGRTPLRSPVTRLHIQMDIGVLPVDLQVEAGHIARVVMTEQSPAFGALLEDIWGLAGALSVEPEAIGAHLPCQVVSTGLPALIVPFRSLSALQEVIPQKAKLTAVCEQVEAQCVLAFSRETLSPRFNVHVRLFAPMLGVDEDPATGSATGALGAYLVQYHVAGEGPVHHIASEQGYEVGRPSAIYVEVDSSTRPMTVRVGGRVWKSIEGNIYF